MEYYGYDFIKINSGGLGAIIHDVMNAAKYAEDNNLKLGFINEGYEIPRLNGSYNDIDVPNKNWHSYFTSFDKVNKSECIGVWPNYMADSKKTKWDIQQYSSFLRDTVCTFQPDIYNEIEDLVSKTEFNADTDIVLHIRQTPCKLIENPVLLPLEKYIEECEYALSQLSEEQNRIYICTDNKKLVEDIKTHFNEKNVEVVWDDSESSQPLQTMRWKSQLSKSVAQAETMVAFKNIFIMKNAKYLIGGRMSYFFRIAELMGYPNKCINIQDNDKFGIAPYSSVEYMIRPYLKNTIPNFVNKDMITNENIIKYNKIYTEENIVTIPDFISYEVLGSIKAEIENYKWWSYATIPTNNKWIVQYTEGISKQTIAECEQAYVNKLFSYRFQRCLGNHYDTCVCISCKLNATVKSFPFTDILCKIVGCRNLKPKEIFLSNYGKDDFLSLHHDVNKGDIAVTISFTYDWDPNYGGILHFCDDKKNIFKSVVPKLGNINIFKLDPDHGIDHFVSRVNVDRNRYTLVAWYQYID